MYKFNQAIQDHAGNKKSGWLVRVFAGGVQQPIYADASSTPIENQSGVLNAAKSDSDGMVRFYVASGDYDLRFYDESDNFRRQETGIPMYRGITDAEADAFTTANQSYSAAAAVAAATATASSLEAQSLVAAAKAMFGGLVYPSLSVGVLSALIGFTFAVIDPENPGVASIYRNIDATEANAEYAGDVELQRAGVIRADLAPYLVGRAGRTPQQNADGLNAAIQKAIERQRAGKGVWDVEIAGGRIELAECPRLLYINPTTGNYEPFSLRVIAKGGYAGSKTTLVLNRRDQPIMTIQGGKGVSFHGITLEYAAGNTTPGSFAAIINDHYAQGGRSNELSPDAGWAIDPFSTGHAAHEKYPGLESYYDRNNLGSNNIAFYDCQVRGAKMPWAVGLSRNTRNCDGIRWYNCRAYDADTVIGVGHDQTRDMQVYSMWVNFASRMVDTRNWGLGIGVCPSFYGGQLTGGKELMIIGTDRNTAAFRDVYLESVWRLGFASGSMPVILDNLMAKLAASENGVPNPDAHIHLESPAIFNGGGLYYNNDLPDDMNIMLTKPSHFNGFHFDGNPTLWQPSSSIKPDVRFTNCTIRSIAHGPTYGISDEIRGDVTHIVTADVPFRKGARWLDNAANTTVDHKVFESLGAQLIVLDAAVALDTDGTGGATFTSGNAAAYHVGQYVQTGTGWNIAAYGNLAVIGTGSGNNMSIGKVVSVDTGTGLVTLDHVPMGIVDGGTYQIVDARIPKLRARVVGTGTSGTNTVTLNSSSHGFKVGDRIRTADVSAQGKFANGTRVTAVAGATLTLSHNISSNLANEPVFDALYVPVSLRRALRFGKPTTGLWWPGDFFEAYGYGGFGSPNLTGYRVLGANPLVAIAEYTTPIAAAVAGTSYTPTPDDFQRIVEFSATSAVTVTLPTVASMNIAWEPGRRFRFIPVGAGGSVIAAAGAGVTLQQANGTLTQANQHRSLIAEMTATTNTYRITTDA